MILWSSRIRCDKCDGEITCMTTMHRAAIPTDIRARAERAGWRRIPGGNDLCPRCFAKPVTVTRDPERAADNIVQMEVQK